MYRFLVKVEKIVEGPPANVEAKQPAVEGNPRLEFEAVCHDDIVAIAEGMAGNLDLSEDATKQFAVGLKLFAEIVLQNRDNAPFKTVRPAMAEFNKELKAGLKAKREEQASSV